MSEKRNRIQLKIKEFVLFVSLFIFCLFLTFYKHSTTGYFNYHSQIWGDKAGYYVYLPALFIYQFKATDLPEDIVERTGKGFAIDSTRNKIKTKYTCGIAILQSPFYLANHLALKVFDKKNDGFHRTNFKMIDFAAVFYLILGLFFLSRFLANYFLPKTIFLSLAILFFCTNLYYYAIYETGMSHVYSFFLISLFLFLTKIVISKKCSVWIEIIYGFTIGLIILIRPLNILVLSVFFIIDVNSFRDFKNRLVDFFRNYRLQLVSLSTILIVFIPQLLYWKYVYDHYVYYSYENEGFVNLLNPKLFRVWFSTLNGQFLYVPSTLLIIIGIWPLFTKNKLMAVYIGAIFLLISYLFASWWSWNFGCGFGIRPFVDYFPIFAIALTAFTERMIQNNYRFFVFGLIVLVLFIYTQKLIYYFDGCWYGGVWDWQAFYVYLIS